MHANIVDNIEQFVLRIALRPDVEHPSLKGQPMGVKINYALAAYDKILTEASTVYEWFIENGGDPNDSIIHTVKMRILYFKILLENNRVYIRMKFARIIKAMKKELKRLFKLTYEKIILKARL